jgi:hypothetical protein
MWVVFEQPGEAEHGSSAVDRATVSALTQMTPELVQAMDLHGLAWDGSGETQPS